jgi:hypothetical protein
MTYNHKLLSKFNLIGDPSAMTDSITAEEIDSMMSNPDYLRQSSSLINDALKKGFDVLQLADGNIVMTGVKTVVYQYEWDAEQQKLVRVTTKSKNKMVAPRINEPEDEDA